MTVKDDVIALLRRVAPQALCDDCISDRLDLTVRQHANHKTRELAAEGGFKREQGVCSQCKASKLVIAADS